MMTETRWSLTDSTFSSAMKSVLDGWDYCHVGGHWSPPPRFLCSIILSLVIIVLRVILYTAQMCDAFNIWS